MKKIVMTVLFVVAAACGGGGAKDVQEPTSTAVLALGDASLSAEKDGVKHELVLTADGKIMADGKHVGTLTVSGEIQDPEGKVHARMGADGKVIPEPGAGGKDDEIVIREDGAIMDNGAVAIEFGADGFLAGPVIATEAQGAKIAYTGAPETRRALALAFMLAMMSAEPMKSEGPVEVGPSPAPTPVTP
jgi:hypothetical protein